MGSAFWASTAHSTPCSSKCPIFVYLYYPMKFERKFSKGPPPCFEKLGPPPAEKKLDPLPWAFGARPRMFQIHESWKEAMVFMAGPFHKGGKKMSLASWHLFLPSRGLLLATVHDNRAPKVQILWHIGYDIWTFRALVER